MYFDLQWRIKSRYPRCARQERDPLMSTHDSTTTAQDDLTKHTPTTTQGLALCGHTTLDVTTPQWVPTRYTGTRKGRPRMAERITRKPETTAFPSCNVGNMELIELRQTLEHVTNTNSTGDGRRPKNRSRPHRAAHDKMPKESPRVKPTNQLEQITAEVEQVQNATIDQLNTAATESTADTNVNTENDSGVDKAMTYWDRRGAWLRMQVARSCPFCLKSHREVHGRRSGCTDQEIDVDDTKQSRSWKYLPSLQIQKEWSNGWRDHQSSKNHAASWDNLRGLKAGSSCEPVNKLWTHLPDMRNVEGEASRKLSGPKSSRRWRIERIRSSRRKSIRWSSRPRTQLRWRSTRSSDRGQRVNQVAKQIAITEFWHNDEHGHIVMLQWQVPTPQVNSGGSSCAVIDKVGRCNSETSLILPFHWDFSDELHVIPNLAAIAVHEEVVDLVVEVLQLERSEVLLADIQ